RAQLCRLPGRQTERRAADVREIEDDDVAGAGGAQNADLPREIARSRDDVRLQLDRRDRARARRAELKEDVVPAAPDAVQRVAIERPRGDELRHLRADRRRVPGRRRRRHARKTGDAGAALREVRAALVRGNRFETVTACHELRPDGTRIRREKTRAGRQYRLERSAVGETVAEEERVRELRGCVACGERSGDGERAERGAKGS